MSCEKLHRLTQIKSARITQIISLVTGFFLLVAAGGCGYTTRSMISDKFQTIYITPFTNKINITQESSVANKYKVYRPSLETDVTKAVTNKFLFDGNLKPTREELADLVLEGELIDFRKDPLRYSTSDEVLEYRINLVVNVKLSDKKEDKLVWQENNFTGESTYFTTGSGATSEEAAMSAAVADLSRRIVERTVEQW